MAILGLFLCLLIATPLSARPRFQAAISYPAGSNPAAVALGDFNNDGIVDIAVVNNAGSGTNNINVLLGTGDGGFQTAKSTNAPATLVGVAATDFNKDGKLDVAILDRASRSITIMRGSGDGSFVSSGNTCSTGLNPVAVATADLNSDGNVDVVTVNYDDNSVTVCLGNGAGGFNSSHSYTASTSASNHPDGIAIADVTGDGKPDVVISIWEDAYSVIRGNGDGTFQAPMTNIIFDVPSPRAIAAGDLNGDGITDLVFATGQATVLFGNGNGTFRTPVNYPGGAGPISMVDLDGDGDLDLVIANTLQSSISVLKNTGNGSFAPQVVYAVDNQAVAIAAADVNRDGKADVVVANNPAMAPSPGSVSVLLGNGDTTLAAALSYQLSRTAWGSANSVVAADLNGDGRQDAVVLMNGNSTFTIFLGNTSNLFQPGANYDSGFSQGSNVGDGTGSATDIAAGDVNNDGKIDLVIIGYKGIRVLLGKGDGSLSPPTLIPLSVGFNHRMTLADFDGDGNLDIAYTQSVTGSDIGILYGDGTGNFSAPTQISVGYLPTDIAVADFNHDGKLDLATANAGSTTVSVLLNLGNQAFTPAQSYNLGSSGGTDCVTLAAVDLDGDQVADIAAVNDGNGSAAYANISILRNDGTGSFTLLHQYATGTTLQRITAADFDGNRINDLAVTNWQGQVFVFSGNGDGSFASAVPYAAGPGAIGILAAPFSNAGARDLAVVTSNASALALLLNAGGSRYDYGSSPNPSGVGLPVTVSVAFHPALKWAGTPTGGVTLQDGLTPIGTGTLDADGAVTFTTADLSFGIHELQAVYSGDANFVPRTLTLTQTVLHTTTTSLRTSATTPVVGSSVTLSATVTSTVLPVPTGSLSFLVDGTTVLGSGTLDGKGENNLTTTALPGGVHSVTAVYAGDNSSLTSVSSAVSVATADFTGMPSAASVSVRAGQPANLTLNVSPVAGFNGQVSFACSGLPLYASCAFSPATVTLSGTGTTSTQLTINTATTTAAVRQPGKAHHEYYLAFPLSFAGFAGFIVTGGRRRKLGWWSVLLAVLLSLVLMMACGGSGGGGSNPPPVTHMSPVGASAVTVTISATMNGTTVSHSTVLSLTITP